jgi:hypothetical protein
VDRRCPQPAPGTQPTANEIAAAAAHDRRAWQAAMRRFNLLDHPEAIFKHEVVVNTVCRLRAAGEAARQPDHDATTSCRPSR